MLDSSRQSHSCNQEKVAEILWLAFKLRLRVYDYKQMLLDLDQLLNSCPDLDLLEEQLTHKENDLLIK